MGKSKHNREPGREKKQGAIPGHWGDSEAVILSREWRYKQFEDVPRSVFPESVYAKDETSSLQPVGEGVAHAERDVHQHNLYFSYCNQLDIVSTWQHSKSIDYDM